MSNYLMVFVRSVLKLRFVPVLLLLLGLAAWSSASVFSQETPSIERSPWQMHNGYGNIPLHAAVPSHGDAELYEYKQVPPQADPGWVEPPLDANGNISFSQPSVLPNGACFNQADFTYFQTLIKVPEGTAVAEFEVRFAQVDDGARAYIYNSQYPNGVYQPGTDIVLKGPPNSANLAQYVVPGEVNRVVIVQVDDCPKDNNLKNAQLYVNGAVAAENPEVAPRTADPLDLCLANVPEARDYTLAYRLDIPVDSDYNMNPVPYAVDNTSRTRSYNRVGYCMELDNQWIWVSIDRFNSGNDTQMGVPVASILTDGFQRSVSNMNVASNVESIVTGEGMDSGYIEFWHHCYSEPASQGLSQSGNVFDFDDTKSADSPSCYGSMQIHNVDAQQTLFAFNAWDEAPVGLNEVGIGNAPTGNPDWTFARNADQYEERYLGVFVLESAGPSVRTCSQEDFLAAVQAGEESGTITLDGTCRYELTSASNDWNGGSGAVLRNTTVIEGNGAIIERAEDAPNFRLFAFVGNVGTVVQNLTLRNGHSTLKGGAIFSQNNVTLENVTLEGNHAANYGGAVYITGDLTVQDSLFEGNSSESQGGAIGQDNGGLTVNNTRFLNNHAVSNGGAIFKWTGSMEVVNSLFAQNYADSKNGAAVYLARDVTGNSHIANSTITDNDGNPGSAITTWGALELTNTIIANHEIGLTAGGDHPVSEDSNLFANTVLDVRELKPIDRWEGSKVVPDARFVDSAALDYRVHQDSPAVDSGSDLILSSLTALSADADGNARPFTGTPADMGAYEFQGQGGPSLSIVKQGPFWINPDMETDFSLTVANSGVAAASDIQVVDVLPAGATYVADSATNGGTFADGQLTWQVGSLAPGQSVFLRYSVNASQELVSSDYRAQSTSNPDVTATGPTVMSPLNTDLAASINFFPRPDGFSFANWGKPSLDSDLTVDDMVTIFGEGAVCKVVVPSCVLTAKAENWRSTWIRRIEGGHCAGMAMGSLNIFANAELSASNIQSDANVTFDLTQETAREYVSFYASTQGARPANWQQLEQDGYEWNPASTPLDVLRVLTETLGSPTATDYYRLSFQLHPADGGGRGHTVVPFAVERLDKGDDDAANDEYLIYIYENNAPNRFDIAIRMDQAGNWSYVGATNPTEPLQEWRGDANSGNLWLTSWRWHTALPKDIGDLDRIGRALDSKLALAAPQTIPTATSDNMVEFDLDGEGYLLVTRSDGLRVGNDLVTGQWISEIDGAQQVIIATGLYNTPAAIHIPHEAGMTYSVQVASRDTVYGNSESTVSVNVAGPGFGMNITDLALIAPGGQQGGDADRDLVAADSGDGPSDLMSLGVDPDNKQITFGTGTDTTKNPTLSLSVSYLSGADYSAAVKSVEVAGGHTVALGFDETTNTISVEDNAAGQTDYNLDVSRINTDGTVDQYSDTVTDGGAAGVQVGVGQDDWNGQDPPAVQTQEAPTLPPPAPPTSFSPLFILHTATAQNTNATGTAISHPFANFNPNANIIVTKRSVASTAEVGVQYDSTAGRWLIVNQDGSTITAGDSFNIAVMSPASNNFVHTSTAESVENNWTVLDHPKLNNNPSAQVLVTPRTEPGSGDAIYHNHTVGVWYLNNTGRWAILNLDQSAFAASVSFNVVVLSRHPGTALHRVTATNSSGAATTIDHPSTNNNPEAMVYALSSFNPRGQGGVYNNHPIRVSYDAEAGRWQIVNQDGQSFANDAAFNLAILGRPTYVEPVSTPTPTPVPPTPTPTPSPTSTSTPVPPTPTPTRTPTPPAQQGGLSGEQFLVMNGPGAAINSVTFAQGEPYVAGGLADSTVQIWEDNAPILALDQHSGPVNSVAWGSDFDLLASASDDGLTLIWDWQSESPAASLDHGGAPVNDVAWNPQERGLLATGDDEGLVVVWDWESESPVMELEGHSGPVNAVAWSPSGERLASASDDGTVLVWDWQSGDVLFTLEDHNTPVKSVSWSADGSFIASASNRDVRVWDAENGRNLAGFGGNFGGINSIAWAPGPNILAAGLGNGNVLLKEWQGGSFSVESTLRGDGSPINSVAWAPGDRVLAAGAADGTVRLWGVRVE